MDIKIIISLVLSCLILIMLCFLVLVYLVPDDYKIYLHNCDIGKPEVVGDFTWKVNKNILNNGDGMYCAVEDCNAYNDFQKDNGNMMRCAV